MILHAIISEIPFFSHPSKEHFFVRLNQFVGLGHNSNVHENKSSFIRAPVEHANVLNVTLNWYTWWWQHIVVLIGDSFGLGVINKFPIVECVSVCVFE
jgi:hypothetical protein